MALIRRDNGNYTDEADPRNYALSDRVMQLGYSVYLLYSGRLPRGEIYESGDSAAQTCRDRSGEDEAAQMLEVVTFLRERFPDWQARETAASVARLEAAATRFQPNW